MKRIETALLSVYDKTGLVPFARNLARFGIRLISTGSTARELRKAGIPVTEVSRVTSFPEMLDGRVKTLHPRIHAGVLADRSKPEHLAVLKKYRIPRIDLVVVNLYPFAEAVRARKAAGEVIEMIDIGGPALLRAAAKNHSGVASVCDIRDYPAVTEELERNGGTLSDAFRAKLAAKVFETTSAYDRRVASYLADGAAAGGVPGVFRVEAEKLRDLRYGENPHQRAALYRSAEGPREGLPWARVLGGKELSFNNYLDMETAWTLAYSFAEPFACVVKHNSPCGAALGKTAASAFRAAFATDPLSAFGGIVGLNRPVDAAAARAIVGAGFLECVAAPGFGRQALALLGRKKNLRLVQVAGNVLAARLQFRPLIGGLLVQEADLRDPDASELKAVTRKRPTASQTRDLLFAFKVSRFVKSNAIVLAKGGRAVGIGTGMPSRVDSALHALRKAGGRARGAVLASDGFFPKTDSVEIAARHGVRAVIQPGGSIQDAAVIAACDRAGVAMVFTGVRHFTH